MTGWGWRRHGRCPPTMGRLQRVCVCVNIIKCPFSSATHGWDTLPTQTPQGRVLLEGFPDPHPFFGTSLPSTYRDAKEVHPGEERKGLHQTPTPSNPNQCHNPTGQRCPQRPRTPEPRPAAGTAQSGETRVIEPGSFIYTVKVTSNFLRLSCSSAIKSWRGQEQPPRPPAEGTPGAAPPGTRTARGACAIASETWLLQVIASEGFVFILLPIFLLCFVLFLTWPSSSFSFLNTELTHAAKHCYNPRTSYVSLFAWAARSFEQRT